MMNNKILILIFVATTLFLPGLTHAATLSLSPSSGSYSLGQIFTVNILLNTQGAAIVAVDIMHLNYNPAYLEVQDENSGTSGVQILPGSLMPNTAVNSVDVVNGRITFAQSVLTPDTFTNSTGQTLASVRFRVLQIGTQPVTFNYTAASTTDCNIASYDGLDLLTSVTNGSYTLADTTAPSVPANLNATAVSSSQINLSWSASTDNVGVTGYRIYQCSGSGCTPSAQIDTTTNTTYQNSSLSPSTTYCYRVAAYDAAGNVSTQSSSSCATTQAPPDTTPPADITNLATSNVTSSSVTLSWTSPGDDGNVGIASSYDIRRDLTFITDFIWNNAMPVIGEPAPAIAGTPQSYVVINLNPGVTYYFAIKTQDDAGNVSGLSNIVSATTQALTLNVSLTASPITGSAPLNNVDLTATVSGTQTGNINYTFYCNRSDTGTNITTPYDHKLDNTTSNPYTASGICSYVNSGTYTAKVIVERGALSSENRTTVNVTNPSPSTKFSIDDRTRANSVVNVRANPSTSATLLGAHSSGDLGIVIGGPTYADGYWWWQINYDSSFDGWSVEDYLDKVPNASSLVFLPRLEGTNNVLNKDFIITLIESGINVQRAQFTRQTNASGQIVPSSAETSGVTEGNYTVVVDADYFLRKRQTNVNIISSATITLPILPAGDFNNDGIINSLDWSIMNNNWFTNLSAADINKDGIVNSLDFSWMNGNWLKIDE